MSELTNRALRQSLTERRADGEEDGMRGRCARDPAAKFLFGLFAALAASVPPAVLPAGEGPVPASFYVEMALSKHPSLASMSERIRMKAGKQGA